MSVFGSKRRNPKPRREEFLRAHSRAVRPPGPYRPRRLPRLRKENGLRDFLLLSFLLLLVFSFAYIWKAQSVTRLCARLDALRCQRQDLMEKLKSQQLIFQEATLYSRIEPLARERLGMQPSKVKPVVISPLHEQFESIRNPQDRYAAKK